MLLRDRVPEAFGEPMRRSCDHHVTVAAREPARSLVMGVDPCGFGITRCGVHVA